MRVVSWLLIFTVAALMVACGGGGEDKKAEAKKETKTATSESSTADAGYKAMAVANGGTITGTVTYAGDPGEPKKLAVTKDTQVCSVVDHYDESLVVDDNGGIKNVVVSIKGISAGKPMDTMGSEFVLDQHGCLYQPHVSLIPVNATLKILNPDGILHNIHSYSEKNPPFNKSQPKFKKEMETSFAYPEVITVKCDVHGWMDARIVVVDHPYYAKTDESGSYTIADVPPGEYQVEFWQEKLGTQTMTVTVAAGTPTTLDYEYPAQTAASD